MSELNEVKSNPENVNKEDIFGSEDFFNKLDEGVNGMVQDQPTPETTEVTHSDVGSPAVTQDQSQNGSNNVDWEKRYKASSKEAIKMASKLRDLAPFVPVLQAMKKDSGLVEHVRDYLKEGGAPAKSVQEKLGLAEDFEFDQQEAMTDPNSDSAKLMNAHVDGLVQQRVGGILRGEKARSAKVQRMLEKKRQEVEFKKRHNMSEEEYAQFVEKSKAHKISLDDIYHIVNKEAVAKNTAQATKEDMLGQMKAVRDIPTSVGDSNSQPAEVNPDDTVFSALSELDDGLDDLFGTD